MRHGLSCDILTNRHDYSFQLPLPPLRTPNARGGAFICPSFACHLPETKIEFKASEKFFTKFSLPVENNSLFMSRFIFRSFADSDTPVLITEWEWRGRKYPPDGLSGHRTDCIWTPSPLSPVRPHPYRPAPLWNVAYNRPAKQSVRFPKRTKSLS